MVALESSESTLRERGVLLSAGLLQTLGQQPAEQSPTIIIAGLEMAETVLTQMMLIEQSEESRGDIESLVEAINQINQTALPILERLEE